MAGSRHCMVHLNGADWFADLQACHTRIPTRDGKWGTSLSGLAPMKELRPSWLMPLPRTWPLALPG